jgi:Glycosyl hydrolases family 38 N-terminal domain/Alpha mannosidase middle domain
MPEASRQTPSTTIHLVPHTHWDREWYEPFQLFRMRLVELIDGLLERMDADPAFRFTLDGQLATVDDYLEVRPDMEGRLRRLIAEGRLAVGPWQILMDEFLASGESMIRNLQMGRERALELGAVMEAGYLPDMFGHVAQMPQLLARAGIRDAVVWRGVPSLIDKHAFTWVAPDGSEVRAEYLVGGYGNAAYLFAVPDQLAGKVRAYHEQMRPFYGDRDLLAMYGTDHAVPVAELVQLVDEVNGSQEHYRIRLETLAEYLGIVRGGARDGGAGTIPRWSGELRSAARANLLPGVTSLRIHLKAAAARAERWLERYAEPLGALHGDAWPERFLELAWRRVVENSAHDSICGCSVDPVVEQVLVRYAEAEQIARGLTERLKGKLARSVARGSWVAVNPSPFERRDLVELDLQVPEEWAAVSVTVPTGGDPDGPLATQEVSRNHPVLIDRGMRGDEIAGFLRRRLHGREIFGRMLNAIRIEGRDEGPRLTLLVDDVAHAEWLDVDALRAEIEAASAARAEETWQVRLVALPRRKVLALVPGLPLGAVALEPLEGEGALPEGVAPVQLRDGLLSNGLLEVEADGRGELSVTRDGVTVRGVGRLVDGGDYGDSYNYGPPSQDLLVDRPDDVYVTGGSAGPLRGELVVTRTYQWPFAVEEGGARRTPATVAVPVEMRVELRAGEPFVRIALEFENRARDHRLRFHVPLPTRAETSFAEGQFAVVERTNDVEDGHGEVGIATFPARGFVSAGGVAALLDHVLEYELIEGRELALTVLRATGLISRNDNPYREDPAGPERPIPDAQCLGQRMVRFALMPHTAAWSDAGVLREAERYQLPFLVAPGRAGSGGPAPGFPGGIRISGEGVVLSALLRRDDWLELRVVAEHPARTQAIVEGAFVAAREADLLGRPGPDLALSDGTLRLDLGPWEIRTVQLRAPAG